MPLAVTLEVTDVLMDVVQFAVEVATFPQQRHDHQQKRQEQQGTLHQAFCQFTDAGTPGQGGDLLLKLARCGFQPFQIQRLVAGDPEHLLIQRGAQALGGAEQLFLVQLQGDRFVEQRA